MDIKDWASLILPSGTFLSALYLVYLEKKRIRELEKKIIRLKSISTRLSESHVAANKLKDNLIKEVFALKANSGEDIASEIVVRNKAYKTLEENDGLRKPLNASELEAIQNQLTSMN